jgi:hypothetical protein
MGHFNDLSGQTFGRLRVLKPHPKRNHEGRICWECRCDCGREAIVCGHNLMKGTTRSCGCLRNQSQYQGEQMNNLKPTPIGLEDAALDALLDAAHGVPIEWRARFLALVADELLPLSAITTTAVELACRTVADRMRSKGRKGNEPELRRA